MPTSPSATGPAWASSRPVRSPAASSARDVGSGERVCGGQVAARGGGADVRPVRERVAVDAAVGQANGHARRAGHGGALALAGGERAGDQAGGAAREGAHAEVGDGVVGGGDQQRAGMAAGESTDSARSRMSPSRPSEPGAASRRSSVSLARTRAAGAAAVVAVPALGLASVLGPVP